MTSGMGVDFPLASAGPLANGTGVLLIALGLALLMADLHVGARGAVAAAGVVALVAGIVLLAGGAGALAALSGWLVVLAAVSLAVMVAGLLAALRRNRRRVSVVGEHALVGRDATVRTRLNPTGYVSIDGESWRARLVEGTAEPGETVTILDIHGLELSVWRTRPPARYFGERRGEQTAAGGTNAAAEEKE